jgi:hypothetical protein
MWKEYKWGIYLKDHLIRQVGKWRIEIVVVRLEQKKLLVNWRRKMEQKQTKISKRRMWSVYVFVERNIQIGRSMERQKRLTMPRVDRHISGVLQTAVQEYLYLNVVKMYKKNRILYIQIGVGKKKEMHMHDMKSVVGIQVREYDRSGRVQ